jgi:hypothetical protein
MRKMAVWRLTPTHLASPHWHASTYTAEVIVRAKTEADARLLATARFGIGAAGCPPGATALDPWNVWFLVTCVRCTDPRYAESGPAEILSPRAAEGGRRSL